MQPASLATDCSIKALFSVKILFVIHQLWLVALYDSSINVICLIMQLYSLLHMGTYA